MWNVIGHQRTTELLAMAIAEDSLPHALLFTGPEGIGKTALAIELAKALNCTGSERPCQACLHCRQIESLAHPDVTVIEPADGKDTIAIQQVRELREVAALRPFQGRQKVYIVAGAAALTPQAADALLKTLEEPQSQVTLVLTARDAEALPATVVSRCRLLTLLPPSHDTIVTALASRGAGAEPSDVIARLSGGNVGWALQATKQPKLVLQRQELLARLSRILDMGLEQRLQLAEELAADRKDRSVLRRNIEFLVIAARDMILLREGVPARAMGVEVSAAAAHSAHGRSLTELHAYLKSLCRAMEQIDQNVDPRLALEAALVNLP